MRVLLFTLLLAVSTAGARPPNILLIVSDECTKDDGEDWPKPTWVFDIREEKNPVPIATLPLPDGLMRWSGGNNLSLAWSPDGQRLAFNRPESSTTGHVFVVSRDGARLTQITSTPGVGDRSVSWSYLPRP